MALVFADRVKETSATTGTGTYTLAGAVNGFQAFNDVCANGDNVYYCATDGTDWEIGYGTFTTAGTTLARTTIVDSSNAGSAVNWTAAIEIFLTHPASWTAATVLGNGASTDNRIARYDGVSGSIIQNSAVTIDDSGNISGVGNITLTGTVDGRDIATDGTKLDGIEAGATADQSNAEIKTAYEANANTNAFTDAEQTKLAGIETGADVTDTTNVTAAGALMDSELASIADVKALNQSVISGASPTFGTANMTDATNKRFMTDAQETKLDSVESGATADQSASELLAAVGPLIFPVGAIYITGSATSPATTLGFGTWVRIEGKFLVGVSTTDTDFDLDDTGGAKTVTLTEAEMPSHTHIQDAHTHTQAAHRHTHHGITALTNNRTGSIGSYQKNDGTPQTLTDYQTPTIYSTTATNQNTGGDGAHENLPPYIAKNIWQRTA